jgi:chromosome segregation ATPase
MLRLFFMLTLLSTASLSYADEAVDQVRAQLQKTESRLEVLDKNATVAAEATAALKKHASDLGQAVKALERSSAASAEEILFLKTQAVAVSQANKASHAQILELTAKLSALENGQSGLGTSLNKLTVDTEQKTQVLTQTISLRSTWYLIAIGVIFILLATSYWYLRRRNDASEQSLSAQVQNALSSVRSTEEKIARADTALADSLFEILNKLKIQELQAGATSARQGSTEPNHELPLRLADEIHRMQKRLVSLPAETKGLTPLQKSVERLEAELTEHGYEIVDHKGMAYSDNLSVKARFVPSDELTPEERIITKVVTPQVNYKGVMIRMADIEVSIGS